MIGLLFALLLADPTFPIMPVADLQRGMKCTGRTVYQGQEIVEFQAEILGVQPAAWGPGEDVIVARLSGPNADHYGVVAGMSGSPIYCDGKLVGALSLSMGSFMKEPIAGITPIQSMLRVSSSRGWPAPADARARSVSGGFHMIATPLVLSGFAPASLPVAEKLLEPFGFLISSGGGASGEPAATGGNTVPDVRAARTLQPGSAVAGVLLDGDVNMAATGTLTWRDGDQVLAFGHSFLLYGDVEMPMATAEIITTVASEQFSYKMARTGPIVGAVIRDNRTAIAGRVGASASLIPVTVKLPAGTIPSEIHFRVFRNKVLTAPMMTLGLMNGLLGNAAYDAEGTVRLDGRLVVDGYPDISLSRTYFDPGASGAAIPAIATEISTMLQKLFDNDLATAHVKAVTLSFAVEKQHLETRIDSAWSERTEVRGGETLGVRVRMRPYRGSAEVREVVVKVPEGTPPGLLMVSVADARTLDTRDRVAPGLVKADDLSALIGEFNERRAEDTLYIRLTRTTAGAVVRGIPLASLPPDALAVVRGAGQSAGGADPLADAIIDEVRMPLGARVVGLAEFPITVKP